MKPRSRAAQSLRQPSDQWNHADTAALILAIVSAVILHVFAGG